MTKTLTQRLQRAVALRDAATGGEWIAVNCSSPKHAAAVAYKNERGCEFVMVTGSEDSWDGADQRDADAAFIAAAPSIVQLAVELGAEVERLEAQFDQIRALRKDEGKRLRSYAVATANRYGARDAKELHEMADGLECGDPLGDCGCEGSCFTCGDCDRCNP